MTLLALIFTALGSGGLTTIILAGISWARNKDDDKATVAERWTSGMNTIIDSATIRVTQLDQDLVEMRQTVTDTKAELMDCQRRCRIMSNEITKMLHDLDTHSIDTFGYRERLKDIA